MGTNESHLPVSCGARDRGQWLFVGIFQHGGAMPVALWAEVEPVSDSNAGKGAWGWADIYYYPDKTPPRCTLGKSTR